MGRKQQTKGWWVHSCSSAHITPDLTGLSNIQPWVQEVDTAEGLVRSTHKGKAITNGLELPGVLVVPTFGKKIISVGRIVETGGSLILGGPGGG